MIKKSLFILLSLPVFLPSCPENQSSTAEIAVHEEAEKQDLQVSEENTLPLKSRSRPQVILTPPREEEN